MQHLPSVTELENTLRDSEALMSHYTEWMEESFINVKRQFQLGIISNAEQALEQVEKTASQAESNKKHAESRCRQLRTEILTMKNSVAIEKLKKLAEQVKEGERGE